MTIEDKLTQDQRLRLECLAQANARSSSMVGSAIVIEVASEFETYVRDGKKD